MRTAWIVVMFSSVQSLIAGPVLASRNSPDSGADSNNERPPRGDFHGLNIRPKNEKHLRNAGTPMPEGEASVVVADASRMEVYDRKMVKYTRLAVVLFGAQLLAALLWLLAVVFFEFTPVFVEAFIVAYLLTLVALDNANNFRKRVYALIGNSPAPEHQALRQRVQKTQTIGLTIFIPMLAVFSLAAFVTILITNWPLD